MMRVFILLIFFSTSALAQKELKFGDTPTTNKDPKYKQRHKDFKRKHVIHWVKTDTKGLLIGNPCMERVFADMGFVYQVEPKGQRSSKSGAGRLIHNFAAKTRIFFRNGPFWKFKLKKKRKGCRRQTGDYTG